MKKLVSLLLAVCMCLSVGAMLTACDEEHTHTYKTEWANDTTHHWHECEGTDCTEVSDKAEHVWNDGEITTEATKEADGVKIYTCTVCGQTKTESVKFTTTITKDEWISNFTLDNYTINSTAYEGENTYSIVLKATENAVLQSSGNYNRYMVLKDDIWYWLSDTEDGYIGEVTNNYANSRIGDMYFGTSDITELGTIYDMLTYDETEKCYFVTGLEVDDDIEYRIYFENGHISKIRIDETGDYQIMTVSNIGTTIIEVPEFTISN